MASFLPAFGLCEMTLPFFTVFDFAVDVLPTLQCAAVIFRFAAASVLPFRFGTTQYTFFAGGGVNGVALNAAPTV